MPFFSFVLKKKINKEILSNFDKDRKKIFSNLSTNTKYFCKNTKLWTVLNKKKYSNFLIKINFEKRIKNHELSGKILFCLPPNLGLGDIVEYALAIEAIKKANIFLDIGVVFLGRYEKIFKKYFTIGNTYSEIINEKDYCSFNVIFHTTLEIPSFKNQKFVRSDIEKNLINYFKVKKLRNKIKKNERLIKKLTIFPISNSPMRVMPIVLLEEIIKVFSKNYMIEIILDTTSMLSNYFEKKLFQNNVIKIYPKNLNALLSTIESVDFGVFMDSGPLHVAKLLNIRGILIENSVDSKILLNDFSSIQSFKNSYQSKFCKAPCGLTNIFNYGNNYGCFDSLQIEQFDFSKIDNLNSLQRGSILEYNEKFIDNPVGCLKNINSLMLINFLKNNLK
jgi:hypothetical protein